MGHSARWLISAASAFLACANVARAADAPACKPLQLINSIKMTTNADRSRFYVPVSINGVAKNLILDTGGGVTQLTESVAQELKLEESSSRSMYDLYGHESKKAVRVATFDLGDQRGENLNIQIAPTPKFENDAAGLLSSDLFLQYDVDLDFGAQRLNYFSQDHCEGKVAYWPERPLAVVPVDFRDGHLNLDVTLDGKVFHAILDTGAPVTLTGVLDVAEAFHLQLDSPELPVLKEIQTKPSVKIYGHNFERLSFGDITVLHPQIQFYPYVHSFQYGFETSKLRQVIVGINVLRQLHIYIAFGEKKLYITPAGNGESVLFKPASDTPP